MRRLLSWGVVAMVAFGIGSPDSDAGKRKKKRGPEKFSLVARDGHETKNGVEVRLDERGHGWRADGYEVATWVLVAAYDGKEQEAYFTNEEPWAELSAFGAVYQAVPADGGVEVTVLPDMPQPLGQDELDLLITAEANRRGVRHDGQSGTMTQAGVARVMLGDDGITAVDARIGMYSGSVLSFDVDPYATITPTRPKGAVSVRVPTDGSEVEAGGLRFTLANGILNVFKGARMTAATTVWTPQIAIETVAYKKSVLWIVGDEVTVIPKKRVKMQKKALAAAKAIKLVQAEADKRDIAYDEASAILSATEGVLMVSLKLAGEEIVTAVVGAKSKKLISYVVQPPSFVKPRKIPDPVVVEPEPEPEPTVPAFSKGMQAVLDDHNKYRRDHCAKDLEWSDELAMVAQAWAERLRDMGCAFEHSNSDYGENLAAGTANSLPPENVTDMWYEEIDDYDFSDPGFSMRTGHFTQVVWKNTKRMGCGMVPDCNGMDIWVCNYYPAGNFEGEYSKQVKPKKDRSTTCP